MTEQFDVIAEVQVTTLEKESDVTTKMDDYEHEPEEAPLVVAVEQPGGPTSWEELDAQQAAIEQASNMQQVTAQFQLMVNDVFRSDMSDKAAAIQALSAGLAMRLNETKERETTAADTLTKEQHYKEVAHDDELAVESDFQGGCPTCQFGESDVIKELSNCPYCWQSLEVSDDA